MFVADLLDLAAEIVAAHVTRNPIEGGQLPELIRSVYSALAGAGKPVETAQARPAVPIKQSVFNDHLVCLACGKNFRMLKRHLRIDHNLTPEGYRERFGLPPQYPLVSSNYAGLRAEVARKTGLGRNATHKKRKRV